MELLDPSQRQNDYILIDLTLTQVRSQVTRGQKAKMFCEILRSMLSYRVATKITILKTSCARGDTICPARCTSDAAGQLQPIPHACGAQLALLPIAAVGSMNVNELMNINDVRESATIFPRPCKLTFNLLILKVVSESRVTWATCVPILVFLSLSVLELFLVYATDRQTDRHTDVRRQSDVRQTDVKQHHRLMPPPRGGT